MIKDSDKNAMCAVSCYNIKRITIQVMTSVFTNQVSYKDKTLTRCFNPGSAKHGLWLFSKKPKIFLSTGARAK